jgi:nicotinate-nucleotide pyrophosphorylase (carboxylating)
MVSLARELRPEITLEASGGITLENVRAYAEAGVDLVSIGALTHSARAMDISFKIQAG